MFRRTAATILWFFSMWALGSAIDFATGLTGGLLAPMLAVSASSFVAIDPLHLFHPRPSRTSPQERLPASASPARVF